MKVSKIYVKKRFNKLTYEEDPLGFKMFSSKPFTYQPSYGLKNIEICPEISY